MMKLRNAPNENVVAFDDDDVHQPMNLMKMGKNLKNHKNNLMNCRIF